MTKIESLQEMIKEKAAFPSFQTRIYAAMNPNRCLFFCRLYDDVDRGQFIDSNPIDSANRAILDSIERCNEIALEALKLDDLASKLDQGS